MRFYPSIYLLSLFSISNILIKGCLANSCEDKTKEQFQVGKKPGFTKNCAQIRRKYASHCAFNANVKDKCANTCGICGGEGNLDFCKDYSGKFWIAKDTQWAKEKSCADVPKNPTRWCSKFNFKKKCPVACGLCTPKQTQCNGLASNCGMKVNELLYATLHNANHDDVPFQNHNAPLEEAIDAGYRGIFLDVCKCDGQIVFCHGSCGIGRRDPKEVFTNINTFLDDNRWELIIFNFEMSYGSPTPAELWNVMSTVYGFTSKIYEKSGPWPSLKEMLDSGKQIIAFQHNAGSNGAVNQIHDFFAYTMGTNWDFDGVGEVQNFSESCKIRRGSTGSDFYSVNHFVTGIFGPSSSASSTLNQYSYVKNRVEYCETFMNSKPNFINIDYWQKGDVVQYTMDENAARSWGG